MRNQQFDGIEMITIRRHYTEDEKHLMREEYFANVTEITSLESKIKELKEEIKPYKQSCIDLHQQVTAGFEDIRQECEYIDDFEDNVRNYFDDNGVIVHSRKLKPSEYRIQFKTVAGGL